MTGARSGSVLFARYAYPPNELGYCGPDAADELLERAEAGGDSPELRRLARGFEGAWPYLELIAHANGLADPLAPGVVSAYWEGSPLLDAITPRRLHDSVETRFRPRLGLADWSGMDAAFAASARAHHNFHVFSVYPWVGLLRGGRVTEPLRVLDRCRIRWGRVIEVGVGTALVRCRPLIWDAAASVLSLGRPEVESVRCPRALAARPGDWCSLHWDWVCDVLDGPRLRALRAETERQVRLANGPVRRVLA